MTKSQLRKQMRTRRRALDETYCHHAAEGLLHQFNSQAQLKRATRIAGYLANDGELSPENIFFQAWQRQKRCYLPMVHGPAFNRMWFSPFEENMPMKKNRYGILEPDVPLQDTHGPLILDVVLLPLVAFDGNGNRLGMGGGYYDRTFAFLRHRKIWTKPLLMGVAYDFQQVEDLPAEAWDVPLDGILTETRPIWFRKR